MATRDLSLRRPPLGPAFQTLVPALLFCFFFNLYPARAAPVEVLNTAYAESRNPGTGGTNQVSYGPVRTVVQFQSTIVIPPLIDFYSDNTFNARIHIAALGNPLFLRADAQACNLNPALLDTNVITLTSTQTGDRESFPAVETLFDSSVFRILTPVPTRNALAFPARRGNGIIETLKGDILRAEIDCGGTNRAFAILAIATGGVVYNSRNNQPVEGALVTVLDASSGLPALVYENDGGRASANPVRTGPDGVYLFPFLLPGAYRLDVKPPPGYRNPSTVPVEDQPRDRTLARPGSFGGNFTVPLGNGPVSFDYPLDPVSDSGTGLFISKEASRAVAEVGDFVDYTIQVKNVTGGDLSAVRVVDQLPHGFAYQSKSAAVDRRRVPDPRGGAGPALEFQLGPIAADATVTLTYRVRITPGATTGDGVNTAQAFSDGPPPRSSNLAKARVHLGGGVFTDRGLIVGKVFVDLNRNLIQDLGEPGVPGVRIYLEDGTFVIADSEGKYDFYGLRPIAHVLKVDLASLPKGATLEELSARDAMSPSTRFVELKRYELHKANFAIAPGSDEMMKEIEQRRRTAEKSASELETMSGSELRRENELPVTSLDSRTLPASGIVGPRNSQTKAESGGTTNSPASKTPAGNGGFVSNAPAGPGGMTNAAPSESGSSNQTYAALLPEGTLTEANSGLPSFEHGLPRMSMDQLLTNVDNTLGFVLLRDGDTLPMPQATVWVKGLLGTKFGLQVNGQDVSGSRVGKRATLADRQLEAWEFVGVDFRPGTNQITVLAKDPFGNARGSKTIAILAPDKLGRIRIVPPKVDPAADGKTAVTIEVLLEDSHGVPVSARTPITLQTSLGEWRVKDLNKNEPGVQVFLEGGRGEFELIPPIEPGDAKISVNSGRLAAQATVAFVPELRPLMAVGLVQGSISLRSLKSGSILPTRSRDGFEEELRSWSHDGGQGSAGARAAFYLKGKIKGEYLLTASFDSDKATRDRLFRDIQPDEFYPIYGDSATKGFDAQSTGRFYVRVDKGKSYLLYGDYVTANDNEARQLGNYNRSLTGAKAHYEKKRVSLDVWASQDSTRQVIEEVPANGTSGPFFVGTSDGIANSEVVEILTRDRHQPSIILKSVALTRFLDYEFEPFTGRLLLRAPVPSLDANLNANSIRITYEVDQGGDEFWVYGANGQAKVTDWWEVGGSGVRDENPLGDYGLYSANTTVKLGPKTYLLGEVARSDSIGTLGDAGRVELRHRTEKTEVRVYYGRAENTFSNSAAIIGPGHVESGVKFSQRLTQTTRLIGQAINTEDFDSDGHLYGAQLGIEQTFKNQIKVEAGGRYARETAPANGTTAFPPDITPNEVHSLGAKVTVPVPKVKNASLFAQYENDVVETDNRLVALGGDYQIKPQTRLYARHEFIDSLNVPFQLNGRQSQNTTVVGLESEYMKDGKSFNEYRMRDAISGREGEAATGLRNIWHITDGLRGSTTFERVTPVLGDLETEATAVTGGLEYTRNPDWKGTARLELRTATANDSLLNTFGYARKLSREWAFLSRTILYLVDNKGPTDGSKTQGRLQAGFAWRETEQDRWNALMKYEFKIEDDTTQPLLDLDRKVNLALLDVNFQPAPTWILSAHYGGKLVIEDSNALEDLYDAHLIAFRVTYEINRRWDIGFNTSVLFSGKDDSVHYGVGPEVGVTILKNVRLGVGYNIFGFHDPDLSEEQYTDPGVYVALRLKFDETLLGLGKKGGD